MNDTVHNDCTSGAEKADQSSGHLMQHQVSDVETDALKAAKRRRRLAMTAYVRANEAMPLWAAQAVREYVAALNDEAAANRAIASRLRDEHANRLPTIVGQTMAPRPESETA